MNDSSPSDPDVAQRQAADPNTSVWVSASAGSGKTKVLTDRVLTLLLNGTAPHRILCLTFTKAAAAEMSNRVRRELAYWTVDSDADLTDRLIRLLGRLPDVAMLTAARQLFARVLDAPGGLKIQTIHSFCESLLARFPLESGVTPQTQVMDERRAAELMRTARDAVLIAARDITVLAEALGEVTSHIQEEQFTLLMGAIARDRGRFSEFLSGASGLAGAEQMVFAKIGVSSDLTIDDVIGVACRDVELDLDGLRKAAAALLDGTGKTDKTSGQALADWLAAPQERRIATFDAYLDVYLRKADRLPRSRFATKSVLNKMPQADDILREEAERLLQCCETIRDIVTARSTAALLRLGAAMLDAYNAAKSSEMRLDYDDLIYRTRDLLAGEDMTPWVLFKLDGGLDHILIDESQDTNPEQWEIVSALAEEFFSGKGAREDMTRTIFSVGDNKQSIFSFQRADPSIGEGMRAHFAARAAAVGQAWRTIQLDTSFRSTEAVLAVVDAVFEGVDARNGVVRADTQLRHNVHRTGAEGRVELWPLAEPAETEEVTPWTLPLARQKTDDPESRLAGVIAEQVKTWIGRETLAATGKLVCAGDIMILVRRRRRIVDRLVRALKEIGVPVAGVDRLVLTEQLAVMDLMALANFLLLPDDDLTLATVLKGPLIGFDDEDLFVLSYDRGGHSLWRRLSAAAANDTHMAGARDWLAALLARADFIPPYELFADILTRPSVTDKSGRQSMIARLGMEAEDPLDEFLNLALAYERTAVPSLQGFLHWVGAEDTEVKRDLEQSDRDEVRVMTVHGAKGLQAPIVILADTISAPGGGTGGRPVIYWADGIPLWAPRRAMEAAVARTAREVAMQAETEEYNRLLYVAMTRAEDRLYICGARRSSEPAPNCWYNLVLAGLERIGEPHEFNFLHISSEAWVGDGYAMATNHPEVPDSSKTPEAALFEPVKLLEWAHRGAPKEPTPPRPLAPTRPSTEEGSVRSPIDVSGTNRFRRGLLVHRLLELLPTAAPGKRSEICRKFLARPFNELIDDDIEDLTVEVMNVLEHPEFEVIFGANSRAEVALTGNVSVGGKIETVSGQVDRLVVTDEEVFLIDYKTMRPVPPAADQVPQIYLRQMAIYRMLLSAVWPERKFRAALLWTEGPILMPICDGLLDRHTPAS
jgi:ATP-dependent helicase/nuclease subunit A